MAQMERRRVEEEARVERETRKLEEAKAKMEIEQLAAEVPGSMASIRSRNHSFLAWFKSLSCCIGRRYGGRAHFSILPKRDTASLFDSHINHFVNRSASNMPVTHARVCACVCVLCAVGLCRWRWSDRGEIFRRRREGWRRNA
jgi:hypothetical protein